MFDAASRSSNDSVRRSQRRTYSIVGLAPGSARQDLAAAMVEAALKLGYRHIDTDGQ